MIVSALNSKQSSEAVKSGTKKNAVQAAPAHNEISGARDETGPAAGGQTIKGETVPTVNTANVGQVRNPAKTKPKGEKGKHTACWSCGEFVHPREMKKHRAECKGVPLTKKQLSEKLSQMRAAKAKKIVSGANEAIFRALQNETEQLQGERDALNDLLTEKSDLIEAAVEIVEAAGPQNAEDAQGPDPPPPSHDEYGGTTAVPPQTSVSLMADQHIRLCSVSKEAATSAIWAGFTNKLQKAVTTAAIKAYDATVFIHNNIVEEINANFERTKQWCEVFATVNKWQAVQHELDEQLVEELVSTWCSPPPPPPELPDDVGVIPPDAIAWMQIENPQLKNFQLSLDSNIDRFIFTCDLPQIVSFMMKDHVAVDRNDIKGYECDKLYRFSLYPHEVGFNYFKLVPYYKRPPKDDVDHFCDAVTRSASDIVGWTKQTAICTYRRVKETWVSALAVVLYPATVALQITCLVGFWPVVAPVYFAYKFVGALQPWQLFLDYLESHELAYSLNDESYLEIVLVKESPMEDNRPLSHRKYVPHMESQMWEAFVQLCTHHDFVLFHRSVEDRQWNSLGTDMFPGIMHVEDGAIIFNRLHLACSVLQELNRTSVVLNQRGLPDTRKLCESAVAGNQSLDPGLLNMLTGVRYLSDTIQVVDCVVQDQYRGDVRRTAAVAPTFQ